jgi:exodeoxyribonuclease-3
LQETKAGTQDVSMLCELLPAYKVYVNSSKSRKGYSGTAILSKTAALNITYDLGIDEHNDEGRVITAEYDKFFLITVYAPNAGDGLKRLSYRERWDNDFLNYVIHLKSQKPVIISGDLNVAHKPIDISRAKENYNKAPGYTQKEIDGFENLLKAGFIDSFRHLYPEEVKYTYWNQLYNARARNRGWRIDYFLISDSLTPYLKNSSIYNQYMGSDHCPIGLEIELAD